MLTVCRTQVRRPGRPQRGSSPQPSRADRLTVKVRLAAAGLNRLGGFPLSPREFSEPLAQLTTRCVSWRDALHLCTLLCLSLSALGTGFTARDLWLLADLPSVPALSTSTPSLPGTPFSPSSSLVSGSVQGNIHNCKSQVSLQAPAFLQTDNAPCQGQGGQATAARPLRLLPSFRGQAFVGAGPWLCHHAKPPEGRPDVKSMFPPLPPPDPLAPVCSIFFLLSMMTGLLVAQPQLHPQCLTWALPHEQKLW